MDTKPKKRLSIDELKSYPGFENFTDEMAEETIESLEALSILFLSIIKKQLEKERLLDIASKKAK